MNKISILALPVALIMFGPLVFAQNTTYKSGQMGMYPDVSKEKIQKGMQSVIEMGLLYKMLAQPTMVAVDNGFVVAYGNTLRKYDKDLNVVKEVNLDVDVDAMQTLASKFAKKYSDELMDMMGGAAMGGATMGGAATGGYPDFMQARMTSNDALAKATLRAMSTAAESYATTNSGNYPPNVAALTQAKPPYLNTNYCTDSPVAGYKYDCSGMNTAGYFIIATPAIVGSTGTTTETITTGGVLTP